VLILEVVLSGHHSVWLDKIAKIFLRNKYRVTIAILKDFENNTIFSDLKSEFSESFDLVSYAHPQFVKLPMLSYWQNDFKLRKSFGNIYKKVNNSRKIDYVFLPYLDYCINSIAILGSPFGITKFGGISHHLDIGHLTSVEFPPARSKVYLLKQYLYIKLLESKKVNCILTQDELLHNFIYKQYPAIRKKLLYIPDPVDLPTTNYTKASIRMDLSIPKSAIVVLVYGSISDRKGLDVLVNALLKKSLSKVHVLLVGKQQESIDKITKSKEFNNLLQDKRMHIINEFVGIELQYQVFLAADIVWLGYRNFYASSGVLSLAANTNNLILGTRDGLIGWYTKEKKLGEVFNVNDINSVTSAINKLSTHKNIELYKQEAEFDYFDKFNWDNARLVILKSIT